LQASKFRSTSDEAFFTGAGDAQISPGGAAQRDIVIFHDWKRKYARELQELVDSWEYRISIDEVAKVAELKCEEFAIHELAHLAGSLAVSSVAVEKVDGKYQLLDRGTAGFISIQQDIGEATLVDDSTYYAGPALDEGWAARNASEYTLASEGHRDRQKIPVADRYYVSGVIDTGNESMSYGLAGMHSGEAGMIVDSLIEKQPDILTIMNATASGRHNTQTALRLIKSRIPARIFGLLMRPDYTAWQALSSQLGLTEATDA